MEGIPSTDKAICGDWKEKGRARPRADSRRTTSGGSFWVCLIRSRRKNVLIWFQDCGFKPRLDLTGVSAAGDQRLYEYDTHIHGRGAQGKLEVENLGVSVLRLQGPLGEMQKSGPSQVTSLSPVNRKLRGIQASGLQPVPPAHPSLSLVPLNSVCEAVTLPWHHSVCSVIHTYSSLDNELSYGLGTERLPKEFLY